MTDYAIPGEPHTQLPDDIEEWMVGGLDYRVLPWRCVGCDQVIAQSVIGAALMDDPRHLTSLAIGPAVRVPAAERDGIPFYGPARRAMRGKTLRRRPVQLQREALRRTFSEDGHRVEDYSLIELGEFDTVCDNCPRRLRVILPSD